MRKLCVVCTLSRKSHLLNNHGRRSQVLCCLPSSARLCPTAALLVAASPGELALSEACTHAVRGRACGGWLGPGEAAEGLLSGTSTVCLP